MKNIRIKEDFIVLIIELKFLIPDLRYLNPNNPLRWNKSKASFEIFLDS